MKQLFYKILNVFSIKRIRKALFVSKMVLLDRTAKYTREVFVFEDKFSKLIGAPYTLSFSNATSSFEAAIFALDLRPGDEVIVSRLSFYSFVNALLINGINIKFVNFDQNLQMEQDISLITKKTKMILVSHLFGIPQKIREIMKFAETHNLKVVEDCSHAHGAKVNNQFVGSFGNIGIFSLQGDKALSAGEGGIAITRCKDLHERMKLYGHMGRDLTTTGAHPLLQKTGVGKKSRMHPLAAGLALVDLKYLHKYNKKINNNIKKLNTIIKQYPLIKIIKLAEDVQMGGFYYGLPIWIKQSQEEKAISYTFIKKYPYPLYEKYKYFKYSSEFTNLIIGKYHDDVMYHSVFHDHNKYILIFLDYKFIQGYSKKKEKEIIAFMENISG